MEDEAKFFIVFYSLLMISVFIVLLGLWLFHIISGPFYYILIPLSVFVFIMLILGIAKLTTMIVDRYWR